MSDANTTSVRRSRCPSSDSIAIAVASDEGRAGGVVGGGPQRPRRPIRSPPSRLGTGGIVRLLLRGRPDRLRALTRQLKAAGIASGRRPVDGPGAAGCRIKTDRRDAPEARPLPSLGRPRRRSMSLTSHRGDPRPRAGARRRQVCAERGARHHLSKFLLRHGVGYTGSSTWGPAHMAWLAQQHFDDNAQQAGDGRLPRGRRTGDGAGRPAHQTLGERVAVWDQAPLVDGVAGVARGRSGQRRDVGGRGGRFPPVRQRRRALMAFVGLVPSEHSSGGSRRQGRITRHGQRPRRGGSWWSRPGITAASRG